MKKKLIYFLIAILLIITVGYGYLGYQYANNQIMVVKSYFQIGSLIIISIFLIFSLCYDNIKAKVTVPQSLLAIVLAVVMIISSCEYLGYVKFPQKETVPNFYNTALVDAQNWAQANNVTLVIQYENSDQIEKYNIISQSIASGEIISDNMSFDIIVSDGPNYDKEITVPQMIGWGLDEVIEYINNNHLNNVTIDFEESQEEKYLEIEQSNYGKMYRRDALKLVFSIGQLKDLAPVEMIDLTNMSYFEATLFLKKNGIPYSTKKEFSEIIERNHIVSQSVAEREMVDINSKLEIVVSKGKEIIVEDLKAMTVEQITAWSIENNLNISFSEKYDESVELGKIISTNRQEGDILEEEDEIKIVISKGQLKMESFNSLSQFKAWANSYNISYEISREYSSTVKSGAIISFSYKEGEIIKNGSTIKVKVSKGEAVTIPNFVGQSKSSITSKCNSVGLSCSFSYGSYSSSVSKDVATKQSKASGSKVDAGTAVNITLSRGTAKSYTLYFSSAILGTTYNQSKNSLSSYFDKNYPGVSFSFVAKSHNSLSSGQIHPSSPTKPGSTIKQGKTYTIYIVK